MRRRLTRAGLVVVTTGIWAVVGFVPVHASTKGAAPAKAAPAKAAPAKTRKAAPLAADRLASLTVALQGGDAKAAMAAAKTLGDSGAANAVDPLLETLSVGTLPEIAQSVITALGALRESRAVPVLTLYAGNRNEAIRVAAVVSLTGIPDDRAAGALLERLGDASAKVRAAAATGLAERKDRRAVDRLTKLVLRNDEAAATALGALIPPDGVPALAEMQSRISDDVLVAALAEVIKREDVPDPLRVEVIGQLAKIPGVAVTAALAEYLAVTPADGRASLMAAQKAIDDRGKTP